MCGRFTLRSPAAAIAEEFGLAEVPELAPRFNIAPAQAVAVVRTPPGGETGPPELVWLRWGLVPSWAGDPAIGNRLINARGESAAVKPAFRQALRRRRCLVVADGFYEWQKGPKRKQPYFIHRRDGRPFGFAGLWERWTAPDGQAIESCTILTTAANALLAPLHDRMPVIVPRADYPRWLDPATEDPAQLEPLLRPYPAEELAAYPVNTLVNRPENDDPRCVARVDEGKKLFPC